MKQTGAGYIWLVLAFVIVKAWNLFVSWENHFNRSKCAKGRLVHSFHFKRLICLFPCRTYFRYVYWWNRPAYGVIPCDPASNGEGKPLNWEYLISEEGKKMMLLYRIANMFIDVPALKERVSRRKWLDFILSIIGEKRTYLYLYTRTFYAQATILVYMCVCLLLAELFCTSFRFIWAIYRQPNLPILNRLSAVNFMETSPHEGLA